MNENYISEINIIYDINKEEINLFGSEFVKNNKKILKMIIDNKEYEIREKYYPKYCIFDYKLKIKIKGIDKVTNMSYMFNECSSLSSLPDISKWNSNNVTDMRCMFSECSSLSFLPDISKWNTNNITNMSSMFSRCSSLSSLPDISKWNANNVTNINGMFDRCLNIIGSKVIKAKFNI